MNLQGEEACDPGKEDQRHADSGLAVDFGHQVRGGDVDGDARRYGQAGAHPTGKKVDDQHPGQGGRGHDHGRGERRTTAVAAGQHDRRDSEAFRQFVQQDGDENDPAQPGGEHEAGGNGHAVEERMGRQAGHHRIAGVGGEQFVIDVSLRRNESAA